MIILNSSTESNPNSTTTSTGGVFTCYNEEDFDESMIVFLYRLSSNTQIAMIVIAIIGIILNITAVYILATRKSMRNVFNFLLVSLYCMDTIFLLTFIYISISFKFGSNNTITILSQCVKLLYSASFVASVFMTVAISHERYVAIEYPIRHAALMQSGKSRRRRFLKYCVPAVVCSVLLNIPEYLEVDLVWKFENSTSLTSSPNDDRYIIKVINGKIILQYYHIYYVKAQFVQTVINIYLVGFHAGPI